MRITSTSSGGSSYHLSDHNKIYTVVAEQAISCPCIKSHNFGFPVITICFYGLLGTSVFYKQLRAVIALIERADINFTSYKSQKCHQQFTGHDDVQDLSFLPVFPMLFYGVWGGRGEGGGRWGGGG